MGLALRRLRVGTKKAQKSATELTRYWDPHLVKRAVKLKPGESCVSATDEMLVTVVGATCALSLRDPKEGVVALTNFFLPTDAASRLDDTTRQQAERYGISQLETFYHQTLVAGAHASSLKATIVGGSPEFAGTGQAIEDTLNFMRRFIEEKNMTLAGEFLGTNCPKKIYCNLRDAALRVDVLENVSSTVANRERRYALSLRAGWLLGNRKTHMKFS